MEIGNEKFQQKVVYKRCGPIRFLRVILEESMKWKVSAKNGLQKVWSFIRMTVWKSEMKMVSEKSC